MNAFVRGVTAAIAADGSRLYVGGSMSSSFGADPRDAAGGREEGERRRNHFVAGPDPERHQRDEQRVGSGRQPHRVRHTQVLRHLTLEVIDFRTADETL